MLPFGRTSSTIFALRKHVLEHSQESFYMDNCLRSQSSSERDINVFCDASERAYGSVPT